MIPEPTQNELNIAGRIYTAGARDLAALMDTTDFQRGKATILLRQIDQISKRMGLEGDKWVTQAMRDAFSGTARAVDRQLTGFGFKIGEAGSAGTAGDFLKVNEGAVNQFTRQLARDLAGANKNLADRGRRVISTTSQQVLSDPALSETIAKGLVSGGNLNRISNSLRERLAEGGRELLESGEMSRQQLTDLVDFDAGVIQAGKLRLPIDYYCRLCAGFQLRQAVVEAEKERLTQTGEEMGDPDMFDLILVVGKISGDECDFYVNKVFSISGRSSEYPSCVEMPGGGPPFHPHCTHTIAPFIPRFASPRELERGKINEMFLGISISDAAALYAGKDRVYAARRAAAPPGETTSRAD